jgi:hypothetical protein
MTNTTMEVVVDTEWPGWPQDPTVPGMADGSFLPLEGQAAQPAVEVSAVVVHAESMGFAVAQNAAHMAVRTAQEAPTAAEMGVGVNRGLGFSVVAAMARRPQRRPRNA